MRLLAKGFLIAWLMVVLTWLPVVRAETPVADTAQSDRLTDYLHAHRLPLVGAQVLNSGTGRSVLLYGYTATDFGKSDAETKARRFLKDNDIVINNRIRVRPELLSMKSSAPQPSAPSAGSDNEAPRPDVDAYKNQQDNAQQQYLNQQAQAYMNQSNSPANLAGMLIPLIGNLTIGMGAGSFGISPGFGGSFGGNPFGGFGGNPYGSYGSPYGGGYGSPYGGGYGSPYGGGYGSPYGGSGSPYGGSPYGPSSTYP